MTYHVDFENLDEFRKLYDRDVEEMEEAIFQMQKAHRELSWEGNAYDNMTEEFYKKIESLAKMTETLALISDFFKVASENYSGGMEEIKKYFEKALEELDILDKEMNYEHQYYS